MGRYDDVLYQLIKKNLKTQLERMPEVELRRQIKENPDLPLDYLDFLSEVGYGEIGQGYLMLYAGVISSDEIYHSAAAGQLRDILFLGDDFHGHSIGFTKIINWELVEVDGSQKVTYLNMNFENYIKGKIEQYIVNYCP